MSEDQELSVFNKAGLPSVADLVQNLKKVESEVQLDNALLKLSRQGEWTYGSDKEEVQEGSLWAMNPHSVMHGYIAWGAADTQADGQLLGQILVSIYDPLPEKPEVPRFCTGWQHQLGFMLTCLNGDDKGLTLKYQAHQEGGRRAIANLVKDIGQQAKKDSEKVVPVLYLKSDSYMHKIKSRGEIFFPVFEIAKWLELEAITPQADPEPPKQVKAPKKRPAASPVEDFDDDVPEIPSSRRRTAAPAAEAPAKRTMRPAAPVDIVEDDYAEEVAAEIVTTDPALGQRRRRRVVSEE